MAINSDSILELVKKAIGPVESYDYFEPDIIMHINSTFSILQELGVGPQQPFEITGSDETWADFFQDTPPINLVKTYVYLKAKLYFDPPTSGVLHEALERQISEAEWRLNDIAERRDYGGSETTDPGSDTGDSEFNGTECLP